MSAIAFAESGDQVVVQTLGNQTCYTTTDAAGQKTTECIRHEGQNNANQVVEEKHGDKTCYTTTHKDGSTTSECVGAPATEKSEIKRNCHAKLGSTAIECCHVEQLEDGLTLNDCVEVKKVKKHKPIQIVKETEGGKDCFTSTYKDGSTTTECVGSADHHK